MTYSVRKNIFKSAIVLIFTILLAILLQFKVNPCSTRWYLLLVSITGFHINFITFLIATGKNQLKNFSTLISAIFGIKFFSYLILTLVYFLIEKENSQRLIFISFIFVVYLLNTLVLLKEVLNYQKSVLEKGGISK